MQITYDTAVGDVSCTFAGGHSLKFGGMTIRGGMEISDDELMRLSAEKEKMLETVLNFLKGDLHDVITKSGSALVSVLKMKSIADIEVHEKRAEVEDSIMEKRTKLMRSLKPDTPEVSVAEILDGEDQHTSGIQVFDNTL